MLEPLYRCDLACWRHRCTPAPCPWCSSGGPGSLQASAPCQPPAGTVGGQTSGPPSWLSQGPPRQKQTVAPLLDTAWDPGGWNSVSRKQWETFWVAAVATLYSISEVNLLYKNLDLIPAHSKIMNYKFPSPTALSHLYETFGGLLLASAISSWAALMSVPTTLVK